MKTIVSLSTLIIILCTSCLKNSDPSAFIMPAEWEPQEAVWMGWPPDYSVEDTLHITTVKIIRELQESVKVVLWVTSDSLKDAAYDLLQKNEVPLNNVEIALVPGDYVYWSRDSGPAFTINKLGERKAVDFNHTGYFRYIKRHTDVGADSATLQREINNVRLMMKNDSLMAEIKKEPLLKSWIFVEGGAYEVNGKGSLMVSEPFLFRNISPQMRDTLTREHYEEEFKRTLGVTNVIWLGEGLAEDGGWGSFFGRNYIAGGTNGHADEFARFANPNTILLAWVDEREKDENPVKQATYERMKRNYEILQKAKDENGNLFNIIKVPMPKHVIYDFVLTPERLKKEGVRNYYQRNGFNEGDTLNHVAATSYLNYFVTNDKVIMQSYINQGTPPETEDSVRRLFSTLFPERELVFIDATNVNANGGGIHCITRQVPARITVTP
jgi:agmatine deiminase